MLVERSVQVESTYPGGQGSTYSPAIFVTDELEIFVTGEELEIFVDKLIVHLSS